ncbi:hypothetical protein [Cupriavidus taiwanensis]|uniref:Uncharacterized protein n=1 Tax=Cupriavidus taiwanensis TaxID=164546 RepID=A0A7Z7JES0_9BURK|nr:hypothetical protein [Cupriavidus taiwanensis]SOZ16398.1 conserved hypothetical protein [Cupriavidus taiwanensis]SOZ95304.1 conserved hypothetical protein [Cupriavidus taiwanensis]SPC25221.1 conserved hypothetical protein [Cupriavidus taiwanensis]SPD37137.1 conserved protein of unknown function [Cupriavidus taiwanensis]SPD37796.1 conserved protein of unknown function [Cupriavidus taiwanensis]
MVLYHAGPQWLFVDETSINRSEMAKRLTDQHGFTPCTLYEPFGAGRGAVIAKHDHMLVMALGEAGGNTFYAVAPSKELQDLIWSFSHGLASQWSELELRALTGEGDWNALMTMAAAQFAAARRSIERAIAGNPAHDAPTAQQSMTADMPLLDDDVMEVPPDYLHSFTGMEVSECAH